MPSPRRGQRSALTMSGILAFMGALHLVRAEPFDALIPPELPGKPRTWTLASGVVELGTAALLALPRTRRTGASCAIALFVGVFPGNLQMARDARADEPVKRAVAWLRLPLQIPLICWANSIRRDAR